MWTLQREKWGAGPDPRFTPLLLVEIDSKGRSEPYRTPVIQLLRLNWDPETPRFAWLYCRVWYSKYSINPYPEIISPSPLQIRKTKGKQSKRRVRGFSAKGENKAKGGYNLRRWVDASSVSPSIININSSCKKDDNIIPAKIVCWWHCLQWFMFKYYVFAFRREGFRGEQ